MVAPGRLVPLVLLLAASLALTAPSAGEEPGVEELSRVCARLDALAREAAALAGRLEAEGHAAEAATVREERDRLLLVKRSLERKLEVARAEEEAPVTPGPGMPPAEDPGPPPERPSDYTPPPVSGALQKRGASEQTRAAVDLGLSWLARHQDPRGLWEAHGFSAQCRLNLCSGPGNADHDAGVTGLALLAFLGAGETHRYGRYRNVVKAAVQHLVSIQGEDGRIGPGTARRHHVYDHAICAQALADGYGRTGSLLFRGPAQKAVDWIRRAQNPYLAWRYGVRTGENDTSVTGFMVAALGAAKRAGLTVDPAAFDGARAWIGKVTEPEFGRVGYTARGNGPYRPEQLRLRYPPDRSESLTAVGMTIRLLTGEDPEKSEAVQKGADLLAHRPPVWDEALGSVDLIYWYWGSLAMFRVGGRTWGIWNAALREALTPHQRRDGDEKGSWDPVGVWGSEGGRVYATAIAVLTLETYYRSPTDFGGR